MVFTLDLRPTLELTDEQFEQICHANRDLKFERTAKGELVIVALTGGETGRRNIKLSARLENWSDQAKLGVAFDSSTGFKLPNGAIRSPDAAWIKQNRWEALTPAERKRIVPLCPDFLVELRSTSDEFDHLQAKMREYLANGLQLGWLLDPETQVVEVYCPDQAVAVLQQPTSLSGDPLLPGFVLDLTGILMD
ncbi:Uma2 family endonuclease [Pantanalinema sp. GBBB05]|uniref:Uma2 family endonuclease n=1 Tax=Pantanalinema sp. GBBB05 TaxID=2604139 RepID=UPI001D42D0E8|nr:Uma2 family endonuclease [Pantanalinema sp. GBBB05]